MRIIRKKLFNENQIDDYDFYIGKLNDKIWEKDGHIKDDVRENLLEIAYNFIENLGIDIEIEDIILTGSLANLNWNKYSDFDLHIITDLDKLSNNYDINKIAVDGLKTNWNTMHDIKIKGYDVEVYIQDDDEPHKASGVYSLLNDEWIVKPEYNEEIDKELDDENFKKQVKELYNKYDREIETLKKLNIDELDEDELIEFYNVAVNLFKSIKKMRQDDEIGLNSEMGEYSIGNLAFKMLRNSGDIGDLISIKNDLYDAIYSMD